jgi:ribosomal protein L11 methyltransferase
VADPAWLEISLLVNGELAEVVAEALSRYIDGGIVIENALLDKQNNPVEDKLRVFGYLPVNHNLEQTRKKITEALWHLGQIQPLPEPTYVYVEESNWMEAWKEHYRPIEVGERFLILPAWINPQPDSEKLAIQIEPGMAFGTGTHPTTQLSLELLERWQRPGDLVIDVGCGSGILSIASAKLGAEFVLAVDVDEKAVTLTEENVQLNQVGRW